MGKINVENENTFELKGGCPCYISATCRKMAEYIGGDVYADYFV